jgi:phenylacetate-CoA ligase
LFRRLDLDAAHLRWEEIGQIPPTPKAALRDQPDSFVRCNAQPTLACTMTGTTGRPTTVCLSTHELQTYIAFNAISHLVSGDITDTDIVHMATSTRAVLGNSCFAGGCLRTGALVVMGEQIDLVQTLAMLAQEHTLAGKKSRSSALLVSPSYLGEFVEMGLRLGYQPSDFGLERIATGSEILT